MGGLPYVNLEGREYAIEVQLRPEGEREAPQRTRDAFFGLRFRLHF